MVERFEEQNLIKQGEERVGKLETEALPKIEKLLGPSRFPLWDCIADLLFPEILPEKRAALEKKWKDVEIEALQVEDPRLKEFSEDRRHLGEELEKLIKPKSPKEILEKARDVFIWRLQNGATATSVDGLMRAHHQAYEVARLFLTKELMQETAQSCLDMLWRRIKEVDVNDQRKMELIGGILGIKNWFPEARIHLSRSPEKAGKILSYLLVEGSLTNRDKEGLLNMLVATRKIRIKSEGGGMKTKEIILGHDLLRQAAKEELQSLIATGKKEGVLGAANFLEERGVLNLDKDADFFETLTENKQK